MCISLGGQCSAYINGVDISEEYWSSFGRMSLSLNVSDVFSWLGWPLALSWRTAQRGRALLVASTVSPTPRDARNSMYKGKKVISILAMGRNPSGWSGWGLKITLQTILATPFLLCLGKSHQGHWWIWVCSPDHTQERIGMCCVN